MSDYCARCNRCHDEGLRDDEECCFYGEPNGCNHPNYGYDKEQKTYEELQKENAELRECLKEACHKACEECIWKHYDADDCRGESHEDCECHKLRAALEGVNHAND